MGNWDVSKPHKDGEPCEDTISRHDSIAALKKHFSDDDSIDTECGAYWHHGHVIDVLQGMPSVTPKQGPCVWCADIKKYKLRIEYYWIDEWGRPASLDPKCDHFVRREIARFCPNCGRKLGGEEQAESEG